MVNPVLVALDVPDLDRALRLVRTVGSEVGGFKVGLELLFAEGPKAVSAVAEFGLPVFADAKLHDIPNTVAAAASNLARHGARWVTVHSAGGEEMMRAAVSGFSEHLSAPASGVLAVTVLTSLSNSDFQALGITMSLEEQVGIRTELAARAGAEGIVSSPHEAALVKSRAPQLISVTPGVRPAQSDPGDQKRVATPNQAIRYGADYLVIGRPISRAPDPLKAARDIRESLEKSRSI